MIAAVERKTFENFTASLSDGTLAFQMQRLAEIARAAVVVEGRYSSLFSLEWVPAAFFADGLARLQVRYPEIQVVFFRTPSGGGASEPKPFGAACSSVPASGAGSFGAMMTLPVGTAAASNPLLTSLVHDLMAAQLWTRSTEPTPSPCSRRRTTRSPPRRRPIRRGCRP